MKTKTAAYIFFVVLICTSCNTSSTNTEQQTTKLPIEGTWKLITGTLIEKNNTTVTDYTKDKSFIKVINGSHFAFMGHDLSKGKDSANAFYSSGGGKYDLHDSTYTEHLEYCNDRQWEGNDFSFKITINNDTLIQKGEEKIDSAGIDRINIEKYVRINK